MRLLIIILICISTNICGAEYLIIYNDTLAERIELTDKQDNNIRKFEITACTDNDTITIKHKRLKAIIVTLLTGPLGGHRIYLGTKPVVPVLYSMTLGGGIFVTVVDLFHLIFARDISRFENNDKFFMWVDD